MGKKGGQGTSEENEERERVEREKGKRGGRRRRRRAKAKVSEKRGIKGGEEGGGAESGSRTESFGLACLACYDGISEMVEPRHRHKKRLTMQKTLHPVAARSSTARLSAPA